MILDRPLIKDSRGWIIVPHAAQYQSLITAGRRFFLPSDQALIDSWENAARRILNDLTVTGPLLHLYRTISSIPFKVVAVEGGYDFAAQAIQDVLLRCPKWRDFLFNLSWVFWYGTYCVQVRWNKGGIDDWASINPDKIVFPADEEPSAKGVKRFGIRISYAASFLSNDYRQFYEENRHRIVPADKSLVFLVDEDIRDNFILIRYLSIPGDFFSPRQQSRAFGVGLRDIIYFYWVQMINIVGWLLDFIEKASLGGIIVLRYPWGNEKAREELRKAFEEQTTPQKGVLLIPDLEASSDYAIQNVPLSTEGVKFVFQFLVDWYRRTIHKAILGQILTTESAPTGLGSGVAKEHARTWFSIILHYANHLADQLSDELIPKIAKNLWKRDSIPVKLIPDLETVKEKTSPETNTNER